MSESDVSTPESDIVSTSVAVKPYYEDPYRVLYLGDCRDILPTLPSSCVNLVLTDPPYGIDYQSARRVDKSMWKPKVKNDKAPFVWWLGDIGRLLVDPSAVACFSRWDTEYAFRSAMEWAGFVPKSQVIWDKEIHGMGDLNGAFAPQHENVVFAVRGKYKFPGKRPHSVVRVRRVAAAKLAHPNEKPVSLMRYFVEVLCPVGGVVLDPFAGSGPALLTADQDYYVIGIEMDERYCELVADRCAADMVSRIERGEYGE